MTIDTNTPRYVAVDLETTTLDTRLAEPLEVAAVPFDPWEPGVYTDSPLPLTFVPFHRPAVLHGADPAALAVNRYYERRLFESMLDPAATAAAADRLVELLDGATLVGANPAYDAAVLWEWISARRPDLGAPPWHHRLYDVSLATRVAQGMNRTPGLREAYQIMMLDHAPREEDWHTALADAYAAADICAAVETRHGREAATADPATYF